MSRLPSTLAEYVQTALLPCVGLVETTIPPFASMATHRFNDGHEIPVKDMVVPSDFTGIGVVSPVPGLDHDKEKMFPIESTATQKTDDGQLIPLSGLDPTRVAALKVIGLLHGGFARGVAVIDRSDASANEH